MALEAGDIEEACRAYGNRVWNLLDWFRLDEAERYLTRAITLAEEAEFLGFLTYLQPGAGPAGVRPRAVGRSRPGWPNRAWTRTCRRDARR